MRKVNPALARSWPPMAFYGFYSSLGGRPVFGGAALEE
jgi:hypothetical protein